MKKFSLLALLLLFLGTTLACEPQSIEDEVNTQLTEPPKPDATDDE